VMVPTGFVIVVQEVRIHFGMTEIDALAAGFLVGGSCAAALLLILVAIAKACCPLN
jgi:hypothetical protein